MFLYVLISFVKEGNHFLRDRAFRARTRLELVVGAVALLELLKLIDAAVVPPKTNPAVFDALGVMFVVAVAGALVSLVGVPKIKAAGAVLVGTAVRVLTVVIGAVVVILAPTGTML